MAERNIILAGWLLWDWTPADMKLIQEMPGLQSRARFDASGRRVL